MARFVVEGDDLVVALSTLEKMGSMHGDVRIALAAITAVRVSDRPWSELRGIRAPGTGIPGVISLCTRRGGGVVDFAAVYGKRPAVVVEAANAPFDRVVVSCSDAAGEARRITEALPPPAAGR